MKRYLVFIIAIAFITISIDSNAEIVNCYFDEDVLIASGGPSSGWEPGNNYDGIPETWTGFDGNSRFRGLMYSDLSELSAEYIDSAILRMRVRSAVSSSTSRTIKALKMTAPWPEPTINEELATWNNSNDLFVLGNEIGQIVVDAGVGWYELDITELVEDWLDGSVTNYGIGLIAVNEYTDHKTGFAAHEYSTTPDENCYIEVVIGESISITGYELIPSHPDVIPGDDFEARYLIENSSTSNINVNLDLRYRTPSGGYGEFFPYTSPETISPGTNWYTRDAMVPENAELGNYSVAWYILDENNSDLTYTPYVDNMVTVLEPDPPEIVGHNLDPVHPTVYPGESFTAIYEIANYSNYLISAQIDLRFRTPQGVYGEFELDQVNVNLTPGTPPTYTPTATVPDWVDPCELAVAWYLLDENGSLIMNTPYEDGRVTVLGVYPPTNLSPEDGEQNVPVDPTAFSWDPPTSYDGFIIKVSTTENFQTGTVVIYDYTDNTSYITNVLEEGETYYWKVQTDYDDHYSVWTETLEFTTYQQVISSPILDYPPDYEPNVQIRPTTFSWSTFESWDSFEIEIAEDEGFNNIIWQEDDIQQTSIPYLYLDPDNDYYWRVKTWVDTQSSDWSTINTFTTEDVIEDGDFIINQEESKLVWVPYLGGGLYNYTIEFNFIESSSTFDPEVELWSGWANNTYTINTLTNSRYILTPDHLNEHFPRACALEIEVKASTSSGIFTIDTYHTVYGRIIEPEGAHNEPILFIHGWKSDHQTWDEMIEQFNPISTYSEWIFEYPNSWYIERSAGLLKNAVEYISNQSSFSDVNIVSHSMGGLVTRTYIANLAQNSVGIDEDHLDYNEDIEAVALIATPSLGGRFVQLSQGLASAGILGASGPEDPSLLQLDPGSDLLELLNSAWISVPNIPPLYAVAGYNSSLLQYGMAMLDNLGDPRIEFDEFLTILYILLGGNQQGGPNDCIVNATSVVFLDESILPHHYLFNHHADINKPANSSDNRFTIIRDFLESPSNPPQNSLPLLWQVQGVLYGWLPTDEEVEVSNNLVYIISGSDTTIAITDESGHFEFPYMQNGTYKIISEANGFLADSCEIVISNQTPTIWQDLTLPNNPVFTGPYAPSISINFGALSTSDLNVTLNLGVINGEEVIVSENSDFSGASWQPIPTSNELSFTFNDTLGLVVFAKYRDEALIETEMVVDGIQYTSAPMTASIQVTSTPPGASVFLNGSSTGLQTPATITDLAPGSYRVSASIPGMVPDSTFRYVSLNPGEVGYANFIFTGGPEILNLISPYPGDTLYINQDFLITWWYQNILGTINLELFQNGNFHSPIANNIIIDDLAYYWQIPDTIEPNSGYTVFISSNEPPWLISESGSFTIEGLQNYVNLTSPNGSEIWNLGEADSIEWSFSNLAGNVSIELNRDYPGDGWETLTDAVDITDQSWVWTEITGDTSENSRIRVTCLAQPEFSDVSDNNFTIRYYAGPINLTAIGSDQQVGLSWEVPQIDGFTGEFEIWRGENYTNLEMIQNNYPETSYADAGLINGQTYWYKVGSIYANGDVFYSNIIDATPYVVFLTFTEHTIAGNFDGANSIYATDMDNDGDMDILGTALFADDITWWENDGNQNFSEHSIALNFNGANSVFASDMDNDGDIDVLSTACFADDITWWENDGNQNFTEHTISDYFDYARSVYAEDMDNDGDVDVLGAAQYADDITWWENDGNQNFTEHTISGSFDGANSVYAEDMDNDGDMDVLGAAGDAELSWWENDGNQNFTGHTIPSYIEYMTSVSAVDMDDDGDMDVLAVASHADDIAWWENDGNQNFTAHIISGNFNSAHSAYAEDIDNDGDMDVLGAANFADEITWWENDGNQNFTEHNISDSFDGARSVYAADIDNDGDMDILGAADNADEMTWWENDLPQIIISGSIFENTSNNPLENVELVGFPGQILTDPNGYYEYSIALGWSGTVTPEKEGYFFEPENRIYSQVMSNQNAQNYIGSTSNLCIFIDGDSVILDWEDIPGANIYHVYRSSSPYFSISSSNLIGDSDISQYEDAQAIGSDPFFYIITWDN